MTFTRIAIAAAVVGLLTLPQAFTAPPAGPATFTATVVGISDGDTLTVIDDAKQQTKIRLHGIDAPESKQAFGSRAKDALSAKIFGKSVRIVRRDVDRYGRTVAEVFVDEPGKPARLINHELVADGFAWHYVKYAPDDTELAEAEKEARAAKRGLWADPAPVAPWDFRKPAARPRCPAWSTSTPAASDTTAATVGISMVRPERLRSTKRGRAARRASRVGPNEFNFCFMEIAMTDEPKPRFNDDDFFPRAPSDELADGFEKAMRDIVSTEKAREIVAAIRPMTHARAFRIGAMALENHAANVDRAEIGEMTPEARQCVLLALKAASADARDMAKHMLDRAAEIEAGG